jgi:Na+-driven multidrug efflux pump
MAGQKTPTALGTENIGKLLMQYAVPAIIAMTASSLYNMVDSIFIGHAVGVFCPAILFTCFFEGAKVLKIRQVSKYRVPS